MQTVRQTVKGKKQTNKKGCKTKQTRGEILYEYLCIVRM